MRRMLSLTKAVSRIRSEREVRTMFSVLFTPTEIDHFNRRWKAFYLRLDGKTQRQVAALARISIEKAERASQIIDNPQQRRKIERLMLSDGRKR